MHRSEFRWIFLTASLWLLVATSMTIEEQSGPCLGQAADVFFVLGNSMTIHEEEFITEKTFTMNVASMFDIDGNQARVGLVSFSAEVEPQFGLGEYMNRTDMLYKISIMKHQQLENKSDTANALAYLYKTGMTNVTTRANIPHIAIVLTNGKSSDPRRTAAIAKRAHEAGITVLVIGIGSRVDMDELQAIGSTPSSVFTMNEFDDLNDIREIVAYTACAIV